MSASCRRRLAGLLVGALLHAQLPLPLAAQQPEKTREDARRVALRLIPADATAGLIAYPRAAMSAASMEMLPVEIISAVGKQQLGFDPLDVEVLVGAFEMQASLPQGALVLRLRQPLTLDMLPDYWKRGTTSELRKGKPYLHGDAGSFSIYLPNAQTLMVGNDEMIEKVLQRTGEPSAPVHKRLTADG